MLEGLARLYKRRLLPFYRAHPLLVNLVLLAIIIRLVYLNAIATVVFDEGFYIHAGRQLLAAGVDTNPEHPPLVKLLLAGSMLLFGDNPLAWRLPAVLFGLASMVFFYFVALELTKSRKLAAVAAALLAFDPLHIILSRTSMLDIFMLAFGLAGAYFLLRRNYAWAGVLFGLGMASKWPAALMLLAVVAFMWLRKRITVKDVGWMVLFAGLAYLLVYTPLIILQGPARFLDTQFYNLGHMPAVPAASPQSSTALQWLYFQKPVWFTWNKPDFAPPSDMLWLVSVLGGTPGLAIVAFGNPVFWIPGLLSLVWLALNKAKKLSQVRLFSVIWLAFNYLPYVLIPRTHMFFYYMLPVLPAYALALSQFLAVKKWERWYLIVLAASILFFLPLLIGLPAPKDYYELLRPLIGAPP